MIQKKTAEKSAKKSTRKATKPAGKSAKTARGSRASGASARRSEAAGDWRADVLSRMRSLIAAADPQMVEERKWRKPSNPGGVPAWSHDGLICTGETYKDVVKLTFFRGAELKDPARLFNSSLEGNTRRAIDIRQGDRVDGRAFQTLVRAAVALNQGKKTR